MKKLTNKQLILIKKCVGVGCAVVCMILMLFNAINYISSSTLGGGNDSITWDDGVSLYGFLFNKDLVVLDSKVEYLQAIFNFSYVIMWISFVLLILALCVSIYGIFCKKNIFSKIGSITLLVAMALLMTISFNSHRVSDITVKYISVFSIFYIIALIVSVVGAFSTLTIKDK